MNPATQSSLPPQAQQLLDNMHGIITPAPVSWWPPAPGWWILAVVVIAALTALAAVLHQRRRRSAYKRAGLDLLDQLQNCEDQLLPSETNRLLKRVALMAFPGERTVINQLFGDAWVAWLNDHCANAVFTGAPADALAHGGYRSDLPCNRQELLRCTRDWLRHHKHRSPARREPHRV